MPKRRLAAPAMTVLVLGAFAVIVGSIVALIALAAFTGGGTSGSAGSPVPMSDNHTAGVTNGGSDAVTPTVSATPTPTSQPAVVLKPASTSASVEPSATQTPRPHKSCRGPGQNVPPGCGN